MTTTAKALPANLKELTNKPAAKAIDDKYTVEILQQKLKDGGTRYLSADTKAVLIWRYMDMENMDFDAIPNDGDSITTGDERADAPSEPENATETAQDDAPASEATNEPTNEAQADTEQSSDDTDDSKNVIVSATDVSVDRTDINSANGADNADATNRSPSELAGENIVIADDKTAEENTAKNDAEAPKDEGLTPEEAPQKNDAPKADDKPSATEGNQKEHDTLTVENTGAFGFFEPATRTLVPARDTVKIKLTAWATKERVMSNINQYNSTRGNFLKVK